MQKDTKSGLLGIIFTMVTEAKDEKKANPTYFKEIIEGFAY